MVFVRNNEVSVPSKFTYRKKTVMSAPAPVLYYFDGNGMAEPARLSFVYGNVEFVDVRFNMKQWTTHYKALAPTGTAPWLDVEGERFSESQAILQYAARRAGLVPASVEDYVAAVSVVDTVQRWRKYWYTKMIHELGERGQSVQDAEARKQLIKENVANNNMADIFADLEQLLGRTQDTEGHAVGGAMSFADMTVAAFAKTFMEAAEELGGAMRRAMPRTWQVMHMVYTVPAIAKWEAERYKTPVLCVASGSVEGQIIALALSVAGIKFEYKTGSETPVIMMGENEVVKGLRACGVWINSRYTLIPSKSNLQILNMWSLVELMYSMLSAWGQSSDTDKAMVTKVNQAILKTQSRDGHCVGNTLSLADVCAAGFYEWYTNGHSLAIEGSLMEGFVNAHRLVYQVADVPMNALVCKSEVPTLVYFNFEGRGESIRLMCHAAGFKFNDVRVSMADWMTSDYKKESPTGKIPYLKIGSTLLSEQVAILRYIASYTNMEPSTTQGKHHAAAIASVQHNAMMFIPKIIQAPKGEARKAVMDEHLPGHMDLLNSLVVRYKQPGSSPKYLVEDRLTWADFLIAGILIHFHVLNCDMTKWPAVHAIYENVMSIPAVAKYRSSLGSTENVADVWPPHRD